MNKAHRMDAGIFFPFFQPGQQILANINPEHKQSSKDLVTGDKIGF